MWTKPSPRPGESHQWPRIAFCGCSGGRRGIAVGWAWMNAAIQAVVAVIAFAVSGTAFQSKPIDITQTLPRFEDFLVPTTAIFKGTPATPQFQTPGQRMYRTMIRQETAKGPDFAGHYKVAKWGCGTACLQM